LTRRHLTVQELILGYQSRSAGLGRAATQGTVGHDNGRGGIDQAVKNWRKTLPEPTLEKAWP